MSKNDLLSYGSSAEAKTEEGGRHIVAISGGIASAWVALWVKNNIPHWPVNPPGLINYPHKCFKCQDTGSYKENVYDIGSSYKIDVKCQCQTEIIYYFNDTKWEHPDLYRFLNDIERVLDIKITRDSDGRDPEQVFYDKKMLGSNRTPLCSATLKAERMQRFIKMNDIIYFGIDMSELKRVARIAPIYERYNCKTVFPIIDTRTMRHEMFATISKLGVDIPQMYKDGFSYNNCSGGCVRAGMKQWTQLLQVYPDVYADRERIEEEFTEWNNKRRTEKDGETYTPREYHFLKEMTLKELRENFEKHVDFDFGPDEWQGECVGICGRMF